MSRRSTPEHIYQASRNGTLIRLTGEGEPPDRAEALMGAYEALEAYPAGSQVYFERSIWLGLAASFGPESVALVSPETVPSGWAFSSDA